MLTPIILTALLVLSLTLNAYLFNQVKKFKAKPEAYGVAQLLHDLTAGTSLVKIERVAPEDIFLRSPRDRS